MCRSTVMDKCSKGRDFRLIFTGSAKLGCPTPFRFPAQSADEINHPTNLTIP